VKKMSKPRRSKVAGVTKPRRKPDVSDRDEVVDEQERILRAATRYLVFQHGMFLVATGLRETRIKGVRVWIITVTLRYTTGHEGYIGDLLYDGETFTFLTPPEARKERAQHISADPEGIRAWNEDRASTLRAGKA
jgi:hypothetical protein